MAKGRTKFKIANKDLDVLASQVAAQAKAVVKNNFGDLRPLVGKLIDDAIETQKENFIPNSDEAYRLGIGKNGRIDDRVNTAWKAMQTKFNKGVTTFSVQKESGGASRRDRGKKTKVGIIKFNINQQSLYDESLSNIETPDTEAFDEIPWMKWFIEGKAISGTRFSDKSPVPETSRTGGGVMIRGGFWDFQPRSHSTMNDLVSSIEERVNIRLIIEGASILGK